MKEMFFVHAEEFAVTLDKTIRIPKSIGGAFHMIFKRVIELHRLFLKNMS